MTREEYLGKRKSLLDKADSAVKAGKLDSAEKMTDEVKQLDKAWMEEAEKRADKKALDKVDSAPKNLKVDTAVGKENKEMEKVYDRASVEYKNAWLKNLARDYSGRYLIGRPTAEETNAFTFTTENSGAVVPMEIQDRIIELVESQSPLYADATKSGLVKGFGIPRHVSIDAGDAKATTEGAANDDEQDTFNLLELTGVEIKKHVNITKKMDWQSIDSFEDWIVNHLSERIAVAKDLRCLSQIDATADKANIVTGKAYAEADIRGLLAQIRGQGQTVVYANSSTIWNGLFGIQDGNKRPIFTPNSTDDPLVVGRIYGAVVKEDDNIPDNTVYIGKPAELLANDFLTLEVADTTDATTFVRTIGAVSIFDAGLENPKGFVKASFQ